MCHNRRDMDKGERTSTESAGGLVPVDDDPLPLAPEGEGLRMSAESRPDAGVGTD